MNDSSFEHVIKAYRKVQMSPAEKREVFKQSMLVIEKIEAVSLAHNERKELQSLVTPQSKHPLTGWFSYIKRRQFVPALVASLVLLFFGSTSMMAEQALPGDSLYTFKVTVNESVRDLTAVTDEAKAKLAVEMTSRRLQEAAVLSAQGKLDEKSKKILQDQFVKKAGEVKNRVASLVSKNNLSAAQEVVVDFESALQTHELILASLSASDDVSTASLASATESNPSAVPGTASVDVVAITAATTLSVPSAPKVSTLLATVKSELDTAKTTRINIQEKVQAVLTATAPASSTPSTTQTIIESNLKEIRFTIEDINTELQTNTFNPSTIEFVSTRMKEASSTIDLIVDMAKNAKYVEAATEIRKITHSLSEVETLLKLDKNSKNIGNHAIDFAAIISASTGSTENATSATSTVPEAPIQSVQTP